MIIKFFSLCTYACLCFSVLNAGEKSDKANESKKEEAQETEEHKVEPWFTGPLLTSSADVVPPGYFNLEPYLFGTVNYARYNRHWHSESTQNTYSVNPELFFQIGIIDRIDFQMTPQFFWNYSDGKSATRFGDLPIGFDYQILTAQDTDWWPAIKFAVRENLPTGRYQKLDPKKSGLDATGTGSFITSVGLVMSKLIWCGGEHWLNFRWSFAPVFSAPVHVKGFNTYGGGFGTRGKVYPGVTYEAFFAFEFSFTRNWVLACDFVNVYGNKTRFKGKKGFDKKGAPATIGAPSFDSLSLAPALEYNWSDSLGMLAGCWFTVTGRNAPTFASAVIAVNYYGPFVPTKKPPPEEVYPGGGR